MKYISIILFLTAVSILSSVTYMINQSGLGDFTTISDGIAAAQDGDVLLVFPGTYYENISYDGKNITITSFYDGDLYDESYIADTVINGNQNGTVVLFNNNETRDAVLNGFTITNGSGHLELQFSEFGVGGGIYIQHASPVISNCIVEHNFAYLGGGIALRGGGNPLFKGNTIRYNLGYSYGGFFKSLNTFFEFCTESLNSIYLNTGSMANDLTLSGSEVSSLALDTFTVINPDKYFVCLHENIPADFTLTINEGKITPVAADLYVAPDGCDSNSGLTPDDPLQTIALALKMIAPDSLLQRTVYVSEGVYSASLNNQILPVQLRENIALIGAGKETTVIDGEHTHPLLAAISNSAAHDGILSSFAVKNFSLINGSNMIFAFENTSILFHYTSGYHIENIDITGCQTTGYNIVGSWHASGDYSIKDLNIYDNSGSTALTLSHTYYEYNLSAENIRVRCQRPGPLLPNYNGGIGGGMVISSHQAFSITENSTTDIVNLEVTDNLIDNVFPPWSHLPRGNLEIRGPGTIRVINATIGDNHSTNLTGGGLTFGEHINHIEIINSIVYGNSPHNVAVQNTIGSQYGDVYISHSLIGGGEEGILYFDNIWTILHWGEGNIDADPLWQGDLSPEYPYILSGNSPARNAGTLDIPGFVFPEFDLAGNPRIYGDSIDMGAYEWNPDLETEENLLLPEITDHDYRLYNYPNPAVSLQSMGRGKGMGTTISFIMPREGEAVIDIYNVKGQFIRRLFNARIPSGEYEVFWNGRDEQERVVSTGFYMYRLQIDGKQAATGRCTFVK